MRQGCTYTVSVIYALHRHMYTANRYYGLYATQAAETRENNDSNLRYADDRILSATDDELEPMTTFRKN